MSCSMNHKLIIKRMKVESFFKRIGYKGKLDDISLLLCKDFDLGTFKSNELIIVGYEDFNFIIETIDQKYFIKIFSDFRNNEDCQRYIEIMIHAINNGVSFPKVYSFAGNYLQSKEVNGCKLRFCVMEFIDGDSFYALNQKPNSREIDFLANQAALINNIELKPSPIYDEWAIVNFEKEFNKKRKYLSQDDLRLIDPLLKNFKGLNIKDLPHCFVHGDIISTNVIKDKNGNLWIIDFASSNYYPRIQELSVLACNLLFDSENKIKSEENFKVGLDVYQKNIQLTEGELRVLPTYITIAHAMHLLSANYEKRVGCNNSKENEYWLSQGRIGLQQASNC